MEGQFWFLSNLQNHKIHLQKYVSMTYNITSLGNYNHTLLNFWSLHYSWNCCILSAKDLKGHKEDDLPEMTMLAGKPGTQVTCLI